VEVRPELLKRLTESTKQFEIDALCDQLQAAGLPYAKVVRPDQLVDDAHLLQSGGLVPMETENGETQVVLLPLVMGGRRPGVRTPLPRIGEHTEQILDWLKTTRSTAVPA
jgi:crotonobetainyl-CoA:carnitine CoA-transferase CaiB-like acyl-CoA transferase